MKTGIIKTYALMAALTVLTCPGAYAAMYKWVDENGVTHYSQNPPPSGGAQEIAPPPPPASGAADVQSDLEARIKKLDEERAAREKQAEKDRQKAEDDAIRAENCHKAQVALDILLSQPRVLITREDGTQERLTDEERQERIKQRRTQIDEFCTTSP